MNKKPVIKQLTNELDIKSKESLTAFLDHPLPHIAELLTGALAMERSEIVLSVGRLAQGALRGNFLRQFGRELNDLAEKGKIKEDYADKKYAFQSFTEVLEYIDNENIDECQFRAIKGIFYSIIDKNEGQNDFLQYQLLKICKRLSSSQLLTLKAMHEIKSEQINSASIWLPRVARIAGHDLSALILLDEEALERERLISKRIHTDRSGVQYEKGRGRLTDLGFTLIETIINYDSFAVTENDY